MLQADGVKEDFIKNIEPFSHVKIARRTEETKIPAKVLKFKVVPEGLIINFELNKGSYATTFLGHLFTLSEEIPVPKWVKTKEYDLKAELETGSLAQIKTALGKFSIDKNQSL